MTTAKRDIPPYTQELSRATPGCFLFLLDQSLSMEEPIGGSGPRKCDALADSINNWLQNMIIRAAGDKGIKDWMEIAVIGYHTDEQGSPIIQSAFQGPLARDGFIPISEIAENPLRVDEKMLKIYDEETAEMQEMPAQVPVWVDPVARGGTPMCAVLSDAYYKLEGWIANHPDCFPPIVVHITDGEAQDGDPIEFAEPLRSLATTNGEVLLFNCSLSMLAADKILFPSSLESLPEKLAMDLFRMSSLLPEPIYQQAAKEFTLSGGARAFVFNADAVALVQFLEMGTKAAPNLR